MAKKLTKDASAPYYTDPLGSQIPALQKKTQNLDENGKIGGANVLYSGSETVNQSIAALKDKTTNLSNDGKIGSDNVMVGEDTLTEKLSANDLLMEAMSGSLDEIDQNVNAINSDIWAGIAFNALMGAFVQDLNVTIKPDDGKLFVKSVTRNKSNQWAIVLAQSIDETITNILSWAETGYTEPEISYGKKLAIITLSPINGYTGSAKILVDWNAILIDTDYIYADAYQDTDFSDLVYANTIEGKSADLLNEKTQNITANDEATTMVGDTKVDRVVYSETGGAGNDVKGTQYWDDTYKVLSTILGDGVILQNGLEMYVRATNKTGSPIPNGKVVYINGAQGNKSTIALAAANATSGQKVIGVTTQGIANNADGFVTVFGNVSGFDTSGYVAGDEMFLDTTPGGLTKTAPIFSNSKVCVAIALNATINGQIFVRPKHIYALGELHGVDFVSNKTSIVSTDYVLIQETSSGKWMQILKSNFDLASGRSALGGIMIKMVNGTGAASVAGTVVSASQTTSGAFILQTNQYDAIGVVLENGIGNGFDCWIVVSGIAPVLLVNGEGSTTGQIAISAPTDGRATMVSPGSSPPMTTDEHFKEIGHCIETKTAGTNVLAKCVLHFN